LVLSGGSAYGAFAIGVMKVLFAGKSPATHHEPLEAGIFSGASAGAFNAALMLCDSNESSLESVYRLEEVWLERIADRPGSCGNGVFRLRGNPFWYLNANCLRQPALLASSLATDALDLSSYILSRTANFFVSSDELDARIVQTVNLSSFIDTQPFHALLTAIINETTIRQNPKQLSISVTNWVSGKARNFVNSDFQDHHGVLAVLASASIPGVFPPVTIGSDVFVDGGVAENTPLKPAIRLGATELHVIDLSPPTQFIPISAQSNTLETVLRVFSALVAAKVQEDMASIAWINSGIRALERLQEAGRLSDKEQHDVVRTAGRILERGAQQYKSIRVHHYFPSVALGNDLDLLDFSSDSITRIIKLGEDEALNHNCAESGCVI